MQMKVYPISQAHRQWLRDNFDGPEHMAVVCDYGDGPCLSGIEAPGFEPVLAYLREQGVEPVEIEVSEI